MAKGRARINLESKLRRTVKLRRQIFEHYSGGSPKCACCGESEYKFLTLDHMDDSGAEHRCRKAALRVYKDIVNAGYPANYQILCWNCNCGRQFNGGICPHLQDGVSWA